VRMAARPDGVELVPPVGDRDRVRGSWDAPVTLVEFGDRLRFVFRVFPLTRIHAHAQASAEAAEAAAAQGQFWEMHDRLFEAHRKLEDADLRHYAEEVGLDIELFEKEMEDHTYAARVREDLKSGLSSGVPGTPTFFINGVRHDGPNDFETLLAALEAAPGGGSA